MPRYLHSEVIEQLKKTVWRIDLVWLDIPTNDGNSRAVYLTDHYHDISVSVANIEPNLIDDRSNDFVFQATSGLMSIGTITDDLEAKDAPLNITLDGIRKEFIATILDTKVKGSKVTLYRAFYNQDTGHIIGKPIKRWVGRIDAMGIMDGTNLETNAKNVSTVSVECRSIISLIRTKQSGLFTSESSWNTVYPLDTSMHNVAGLVDREFNFGKK